MVPQDGQLCGRGLGGYLSLTAKLQFRFLGVTLMKKCPPPPPALKKVYSTDQGCIKKINDLYKCSICTDL
jgi:hypothetical protein